VTLDEITKTAIDPAMAMLPTSMDSPEARLLLLTIGLQESRFVHRKQMGDGPARGFWQFERGGGVKGVLNHKSSSLLAKHICTQRKVSPTQLAVWEALGVDDVLAAAFARLLLFTDPFKLPAIGNIDGAWDLYAKRCWRPGKPHPQTWAGYYQQARQYLGV